MAGSLDQNIEKCLLVIDKDLNVITADSNFYRFVNSRENINLEKIIMPYAISFFKDSLQTYDKESNNSVLLPLVVRERNKKVICNFELLKNGQYRLLFIDANHQQEIYDEAIANTNFNAKILGLMDLVFFNYSIIEESVTIESTKSLEIMRKFDFKDFVSSMEQFLGIEECDELNHLYEDLSKNRFDISYKLTKKKTKITTFSIKNELNKVTNIIGVIGSNESKTLMGLYSLDGLTQVYNRKAITDMMINHIDVNKDNASVFIIDIDHFKQMNDRYGHIFGDEVLMTAAKIIKDSVGNKGVVGRYGGDEFVVMLSSIDEDEVRAVARDIKLGIQWAFASTRQELILTTSMGIARYPNDAGTYKDTLFVADKCLYLAKRKGRNCYIIYRPDKHAAIYVSKEEMERAEFAEDTLFSSTNSFKHILDNIKKKDKFENTFKEVLDITFTDSVSIYINNNLKYFFGEKYMVKDFRKNFITNEDYYRYFNYYGVLVNENINKYEVTNRDTFLMYFENLVVVSIEIRLFHDGDPFGLICFDRIGKAHAKCFSEKDISFLLVLCKYLEEELYEDNN